MIPPLHVAASGADVIAAWAFHSRRLPHTPPIIATFAWDRLVPDPHSNPQSVHDFEGLQRIDALNYAFRPDTLPRRAGGSMLPRLSATIDATLVLLDATGGVRGLREQLRSLARTVGAEHFRIVDIGGGILASGDEHDVACGEERLGGCLGDLLALAAMHEQDAVVEVSIAGAGLDGELPEADVLDRLGGLHGALVQQFGAEHAQRIMPILDWSPSEATAMIAAAALGLRGVVEIHRAGRALEITDTSPLVYSTRHQYVFAHNRTAQLIAGTTTLAEASDLVRAATRRPDQPARPTRNGKRNRPMATHHVTPRSVTPRNAGAQPGGPGKLVAAAQRYCADAAARGIDFVTFLRIAEVLGLHNEDLASMRHQLIALQPQYYKPPLWAVRAGVSNDIRRLATWASPGAR